MRIRNLRCLGAFSLALGLVHCGGQSAGPDGGDPRADAGLDQRISSPEPDANDASSGTAVWDATSTGFELTIAREFLSQPTGNQCDRDTTTYAFTTPRHLSVTGCSHGYLVTWEVELEPAAESKLRDALAQLRTTGDDICGADAPDIKMLVFGPSGGPYESNFYRACPQRTPVGKGIEFSDLMRLGILLDENRPAVPPIPPPDAASNSAFAAELPGSLGH